MPSARVQELLGTIDDPFAGLEPQPLLDSQDGSQGFAFYDRDGQPISMRQWMMLWSNLDERIVAADEIGPYIVSTVWLGIDHGSRRAGATPLIFETMIFASELSFSRFIESFEDRGVVFPQMPSFAYHKDHGQRRWHADAEAREGHKRVCDEVRLTLEATADIDPRTLGEQ